MPLNPAHSLPLAPFVLCVCVRVLSLMDSAKILLTSRAFLDLDGCLARGELPAPLVATLKTRFAELFSLTASHSEAERDALSSYATLSVQLDSARAELPVAQGRRNEALEALASDEAERAELRAAVASLKQREGDTLDRNSDLASRLEMAQGELEAASASVAAEVEPLLRALGEEAEEAASEAAGSAAALEACEAGLENARLRCETLQRLCAKHTATLDSLRTELVAAQREPAKLALQLEGVERLHAGVAGEVARTQAELGRTQAAVAAQEAALGASSKELAALKARLVAHTAEVAAREAEVAACEALVGREKAAGRELTEQRLALEDETEAAGAAGSAARASLASANLAYDKARKALKRAQEAVGEARARRAPLGEQAAAARAELEAGQRQARASAAAREAVTREMDVLVAQYLREEAGEKRGRSAVAEAAGACAAAEAERASWAVEEGVAVKQLTALKAARDLKKREEARLQSSLREVLARAEALESEAVEAQAALTALARSEAGAYKLYELASGEVAALAGAEAACSAAAAQLGEQRALLASELEVLSAELAAKRKACAVEEGKREGAREARDKLGEKLSSVRAGEEAAAAELEGALLELGALRRGVAAAQRAREVASRAHARAEEQKHAAGIRLTDAEEEYQLLTEKAHAQERARERGEVALRRLREEIEALATCKREMQGALNKALEKSRREENDGEVEALERQLEVSAGRGGGGLRWRAWRACPQHKVSPHTPCTPTHTPSPCRQQRPSQRPCQLP